MRMLYTVRPATLFAVFISLALWMPVASAADSDAPPRILVSGEGRVDIAPDMAVLSLMVIREAPTARAALDANSAAMAEVLKAMQAAGIAERDLQTANFSIQPRYTQPPRQSSGEREAPRIVGYSVRNGLTVRVRDIDRVGEIIDTSVTLGVNEGGRILFTNDDPSAALTRARGEAVRDALARAGTLAEAAGVKTGAVLEISEQSHRPGPVPMARADMAMAMSADAVPVAAGENSYTVTVSVSVAIDQ